MSVYTTPKSFTPKKWDLSGLTGISDATLEMHFGLYEGYVKNVNLLDERLAELRENGKAAGSNPSFAELVRRIGFEYNGMRLHELYFGGMTKNATGVSSGRLHDLLGAGYGGFDRWKSDLAAIGAMRGIGWAIAYYDMESDRIQNVWVDEHQDGNLAGCIPVVVMDVWEHAFIKDYKPSEKSKYIEAFFANVDWKACEARLP